MRLGIVADIHDAVTPLLQALSTLRENRADRIITMGDAFESYGPGEPGARVAGLLRDANAVGVWGNHDFGLSYEVPSEIRDRADPALLAYASRLQPHLVIEGCRFSHIEPWKDARRIEDLWVFDGLPATGERARLSFRAVPERIIFVGHFHSCTVVRGDGPVEWDGGRPIRLHPPDRYLVLVPAVLNGWCAIFDTTRSEFTTLRCRE